MSGQETRRGSARIRLTVRTILVDAEGRRWTEWGLWDRRASVPTCAICGRLVRRGYQQQSLPSTRACAKHFEIETPAAPGRIERPA